MSILSNEEISTIRNSVDIIDVISSYISLTKRGKNYFGVCPFHDDNNPSMSVSPEKQIYTCFSCGATGNVFNFVMDYENVTFPEALKIIADKSGIEINIGQAKSYNNKNNDLYEIYDISQKFYQNNINTADGKKAKEYLHQRDINDDIIKEFGIGLSLKKRDILTSLLQKKQFDSPLLLKSGLVVHNEYGYNDIYYNRIMFPLWDITGKIVGYSGRIYEGEDTSKYINTKETEIFKKGEILYNYHRAKDECRIKQTVIIMEGFMDVIRAYSVGIKNVVATMGTAVTKNQAILIKRLAKEVILCFDADAAGAKATLACSEELNKIGIIPKIVRLEDNLDPDDYIKKYGKHQFLQKIENPINIMDFKISYFKNNRNLTDNEQMAQYLNKIINELSKIDDEILRELTLKKISEESKIDITILRNKLKSRTKEEKTEIESPREQKNIKTNKYTKSEQNLVYYMLKSKEVIKIYNKKITFMPTEKYRHLAKEISYFYKSYNYINIADFLSFVSDSPSLLKTIGEIESLNLRDEYTIDEINDYINVIKEYNIKFETNRLKEKMKAEVDPVKKAAIAQKIVELKVKGEQND
jgi:DNA primase